MFVGILQILYLILMYLCKIDYDTDNFTHAPTFNYNEVMGLFELASVVGLVP